MKKRAPVSRKSTASRALDSAIAEARDHVKQAKKKSKLAKAELKEARAKLKAVKRARKEAAAKAAKPARARKPARRKIVLAPVPESPSANGAEEASVEVTLPVDISDSPTDTPDQQTA